MKIINKLLTALLPVCIAGATAAAQSLAADGNLLSSANLKKADFNNGTDVTSVYNHLTDGDLTTGLAISRNTGTNTHYAVYELSEDESVSSLSVYSVYSVNDSTPDGSSADIIFYGSNDDNLALLTAPPAEDLGWDGDGGDKSASDFKNTYGLTFIANAKKGTESTETVNGQTVYRYTTNLKEEQHYKYIVVLMNGWIKTYASEIVLNAPSELEAGEILCFENAPIVNSQMIKTDNGAVINVGTGYSSHTMDIPDLSDTVFSELSPKQLYRINAIDKTGDEKWKGSISVRVNIPEAGKYTMSILAFSNDERSYSVSDDGGNSNVIIGSYNGNTVLMREVDLNYTAPGVKNIKIESAGDASPNFVALVINRADEDKNTVKAVEIADSPFSDGSRGWYADVKVSGSANLSEAVWRIANDKNGTADVKAKTSTTVTNADIRLGLVLTSEAIGDNNIKDVQFIY